MSDISTKIYDCLVKHGFFSEFTQNKSRLKLKVSYSNKNLFSFVRRFIKDNCGIELSIDTPNNSEWYNIYKHSVKPVLDGKLNKNLDSKTEAGIITPASAIYLALFELYGYEAPERMYRLLEPVLVEKLTGATNGGELLFYPVSEERLKQQLKVVKRVIALEPSICKVPIFTSTFCSKSKILSKSLSKRCYAQIRKVCLEVERNA